MKIQATRKDAYQLIHDGILAFARAERQGMRIDVEYCERKKNFLTRKINYLKKQLEDTKFYRRWEHIYGGKTNIQSNLQLSKILYQIMKFTPPKQTESGEQGATDEETLLQFDIPELQTILEIRKLTKVRDTYLDAFVREQVDGVLHPFFNLHTVKTYRSSSSNVNFQNIPKRDQQSMKLCRQAIFPKLGHQILAADFCLGKGTLIETIDGKMKIEEVVKKYVTEDIYVYCYDFENKRIGISKVIGGGLKKRKDEVLQITLDNGKIIKATPDHQFLLRNQRYCRADKLQPGDSLMPFYKRVVSSKSSSSNYTEIYLNNGERMLSHNLIALDIHKTRITGSNLVVHHKNSNGCDNSLNNLQIMDRKEHMKIHSIQGWEKHREERIENHWMKTKQGRTFARKMNQERKKKWKEVEWIEFGSRVAEGIRRKGNRKKENNGMWGKIQSEETKKKIAEAKRGKKSKFPIWNKGLTKDTSPIIAEMARKHLGRKTSKETKEKLSKIGKGRPAWNKGLKGIFRWTEETKQLLSKRVKERWAKKKKEIFTCPICGKKCNSLLPPAHITSHGISYAEYKEKYNHKVVSIQSCAPVDTYNISVEKHHNFALDAGVIVKNSGIEVRVACCVTEDPKLIDDTLHGDMHGDMAVELYMLDGLDKHYPGEKNLRQGGKNSFVFPEFYGDYYGNCAQGLLKWAKVGSLRDGTPALVHLSNKGLVTLNRDGEVKNSDKFIEHVKKVEDLFWNVRYKVYTRWKNKWWADYQKKGYVDLFTGFRCGGTVMTRNECLNIPIQGAAFHCLLWSFIEVDRIAYEEEQWDSKPIGQIHDEMILDVHPEELLHVAKIVHRVTCKDLRNHWNWIIIPLQIEADLCAIDSSWADKDSYELPAVD